MRMLPLVGTPVQTLVKTTSLQLDFWSIQQLQMHPAHVPHVPGTVSSCFGPVILDRQFQMFLRDFGIAIDRGIQTDVEMRIELATLLLRF